MRSWLKPLNPPMQDWRDRSVWVVGASSGIGRATAEALLQAGAKVAVSSRQEAPLQALAQQYPHAWVVPADVTSLESLQDAAQQVQANQGLDWVIYCAGHYQPLRADHYDLGQMMRHQDVNYLGALRLLDVVLPSLLSQQRGHVSLVASVAGYRGLPQSLAYGPTKAALIHLAEALYLDLQSSGIGVSVVNPGFVETPLTAQNDFHMPALIQPQEAARQMLAGWAAGDFEIHYPRRFTRVLKFLRCLPYRLYFQAIRKATGL
ncbi:MAG: SDR family NAD(P)-dependent oxidoreductase [Limnohabitans sp.]|nr:SDR family NAD(P)-dependent oxidoreductase [Limnohabitans sp.]